MTYTISDEGRKTLHTELDRIIDQVNGEGFDQMFALPDLGITLTRVNEKKGEEDIVRVEAEFAEFEDGTLELQEEYTVHDIYRLYPENTDDKHPYHHVRAWD